MFDNRVLRRVFGSTRDEVTVEWGRLHNEELCDLYCSSNVIRVSKSRIMRCEYLVAPMGGRRFACRVLIGKPEGKRPLERSRYK